MTPILTGLQMEAVSLALQVAAVVALIVVGHFIREGLAAVAERLTTATSAQETITRLRALCGEKGGGA